MTESLICCSILRDFLIKGSYNKSIDKAVHTDNSVSAEYFNAVVDLLAGMIKPAYSVFKT